MSQHPCANRVALSDACAAFLKRRLEGEPVEVVKQVGPALADAYMAGAREASGGFINCVTDVVHGPCRKCPGFRDVLAHAAAMVAESHGVPKDGVTS